MAGGDAGGACPQPGLTRTVITISQRSTNSHLRWPDGRPLRCTEVMDRCLPLAGMIVTVPRRQTAQQENAKQPDRSLTSGVNQSLERFPGHAPSEMAIRRRRGGMAAMIRKVVRKAPRAILLADPACRALLSDRFTAVKP
jgi:hypothetical protein